MLDLFQSFAIKNRFGNNGFRGYLKGGHTAGRVSQILKAHSQAGKDQRKKLRLISKKARQINRSQLR